MSQTLVTKVRLYPTAKQAEMFKAVTKEYRRLCNIVSQWYFDHHFQVTRKDFNRDMYHPLRQLSPQINSAMVQSTYRTVEAHYKAVATQLAQHPYRYNTGEKDASGKDIWRSAPRDLNWLWKPIRFKRPQADYVRRINYSFVQHGTKLSLNVLGERIKVAFNVNYVQPWFALDAQLGTAKLVQLKRKWFLHIPITINTPDWQRSVNQHIVGIDRGLRQIMTVYDEHGKTSFFNGKRIAFQRRKFNYLRAKLQAKGTKSAKRHLKRIAGRENRWMSDVNHCLSKTLVQHYGANTLFVLEDLTNVSFDENNLKRSKTQKQALRSWAFYELQTKLTYKAQQVGSQVITVSPKYTSQRCPRCGQIDKNNRNHDIHQYHCYYCGFTTNDDRVAAMNLYNLGRQYIIGNENPQYKLINGTD